MHNYNPNLWGSSAWTFLMYIGMAYPDNPTDVDKEYMKLFLRSMGNVLPCEKCRVNFSNHLLKLPLNDYVLSNRYNLLDWLATINNQIRMNNGETSMNNDDIIDKYITPKSYIQGLCSYTFTISLICIIILLFILSIYVVYYNKSR